MSVIRTRQFREIFEVDVFLGGGLIGGADVVGGKATAGGTPGAYGVSGLVGKTFKLSQPAAYTVTFVAGASSDGRLTPAEIKTQIEAVTTLVFVSWYNHGDGSSLVLREKAPANGVTVDHTGTATALLGFNATVDTVGIVYGGVGGSAPCLQGAYSTNGNVHVLLTLE